jgi:hypothetical protein
VGYLRAVRETGSQAPVGVEVFSDELHAEGAADAARRAADATRRVLGALDPPPAGGEAPGAMAADGPVVW